MRQCQGGCGDTLSHKGRFCSDACKPKCSVSGCTGASRKRGWCASHYHQARISGAEPLPFKHKWSNHGACLNCGKDTTGAIHRRYCSDNCRVTYKLYGGPRPISTSCVACGIEIDLTARNARGQLRRAVTKFCRPCKQDYAKYKLSARELAQRDGTDCGICGLPVDLDLRRVDGLDCPSVDHVVPRSHGGTHDPANLQLAHLRCNMAKSDRVSLSPALQAPRRMGVIAS
jgi:5-methylcytosine-specific restriction endonuclease McrA